MYQQVYLKCLGGQVPQNLQLNINEFSHTLFVHIPHNEGAM
jgi:hypothetical protein